MQGLKDSLKTPVLAFIVCLLIGIYFEFGINKYFQIIVLYVMVNMIMSMSLNLVNGYTGQFSLGHAGFVAIGAYVSAFLSVQFPPTNAFCFLIYIASGGLAAALAGLVVGLPSLRLRGDYLAIVTLGFGEIVRVILLNLEVVGGARGYTGIAQFPRWNIFGMEFSRFAATYTITMIWVLITFFVIWRLIKSSYGLAFLSVRDDEIAAEAMGVPTTSTKVWAFIISSFFAGVSGALLAHITYYISPSTFTFIMSVNAIIMVVLGGMGSMTGSIVAAVVITILPEALRPLQAYTGSDYRMMIYSLFLVLLMIWRPQGLFGCDEFPDVWKRLTARIRGLNAK